MTKDTHEYPTGIAHLLPPVHPGSVLADEMRARGLTSNSLALALRVPGNRISDVVRGRRAMSAETRCASAAISTPGPTCGSIFRRNTTLHSRNVNSVLRSPKK